MTFSKIIHRLGLPIFITCVFMTSVVWAQSAADIDALIPREAQPSEVLDDLADGVLLVALVLPVVALAACSGSSKESAPTSSTTPAISCPSVKGRVMPRVVSSFLPPPKSA